jgi:peptide deformylase
MQPRFTAGDESDEAPPAEPGGRACLIPSARVSILKPESFHLGRAINMELIDQPPTLPIAQLGQPVLRRKADPLPPEAISSPELRELVEKMLDTLRHAGGVGLAAPQVFFSQRVFLAAFERPNQKGVVDVEVFINPRLTPRTEEKEPGWEGCLSFAELTVLVPRFKSVRIEYTNLQGEPRAMDLDGFPARVVQHENDHLDGILTIDRAASTRDIVKTSEMETVFAEREAKELATDAPGAAQ